MKLSDLTKGRPMEEILYAVRVLSILRKAMDQLNSLHKNERKVARVNKAAEDSWAKFLDDFEDLPTVQDGMFLVETAKGMDSEVFSKLLYFPKEELDPDALLRCFLFNSMQNLFGNVADPISFRRQGWNGDFVKAMTAWSNYCRLYQKAQSGLREFFPHEALQLLELFGAVIFTLGRDISFLIKISPKNIRGLTDFFEDFLNGDMVEGIVTFHAATGKAKEVYDTLEEAFCYDTSPTVDAEFLEKFLTDLRDQFKGTPPETIVSNIMKAITPYLMDSRHNPKTTPSLCLLDSDASAFSFNPRRSKEYDYGNTVRPISKYLTPEITAFEKKHGCKF